MRSQSIFKRGVSLLLAAVMVSSNMGSTVTFASSVLTPTDGVETYSDDFDQSGGYEDFNTQSNVSAEEERAEKKGETATEKQQAQENNVQEQGQQQEQPAQEAQAETQQVQETEVKKLTSATFDLGKSSVEIYDDSENPGTAVVIYNGETFKNVKDTTYTFTGSTKANSISVMTDREYVIKLKDLSMDGDVPITLWGKGKFNVDVDNVYLNTPDTAMFFAGNCAVDLSVKKDSQLITKGNIGATQDNVSMAISGSYIHANYIFTGGPLYINGGNIDAIAQNAINGNSNLYPVTITGLDSNSVFEATISVEGQNYGYGSFKSSENGSATLYLPEGLVHISVNGNNYEGQNTVDGLDLEKIVETEVNTEETTESQSEQTEAVETESSSETESAVETEVSTEAESATEALTEAEDSISFGYTEDSNESEVETESATEQEKTVETEALTEALAEETESEAISETVEETESEVVATEEPIKLLSAMSETFSVTASKKENEEFSATDTLVTGSEDIEISEDKVVQAIQASQSSNTEEAEEYTEAEEDVNVVSIIPFYASVVSENEETVDNVVYTFDFNYEPTENYVAVVENYEDSYILSEPEATEEGYQVVTDHVSEYALVEYQMGEADSEVSAEQENLSADAINCAVSASVEEFEASGKTSSYTGDLTVNLNVKNIDKLDSITSTTTLNFPEGTILPSLEVVDNKVVEEGNSENIYIEPFAYTDGSRLDINDVKVDGTSLSVNTTLNYAVGSNPEANSVGFTLHGNSVKVELADPVYQLSEELIEENNLEGVTTEDLLTKEELDNLDLENSNTESSEKFDDESNKDGDSSSKVASESEITELIYPDIPDDSRLTITSTGTLLLDDIDLDQEFVPVEIPILKADPITVYENHTGSHNWDDDNISRADKLERLINSSNQFVNNKSKFTDVGSLNLHVGTATRISGEDRVAYRANNAHTMARKGILLKKNETVTVRYPGAAGIMINGSYHSFDAVVTWTNPNSAWLLIGCDVGSHPGALCSNVDNYYKTAADALNGDSSGSQPSGADSNGWYGDAVLTIESGGIDLSNAKWQCVHGDIDNGEYWEHHKNNIYAAVRGSSKMDPETHGDYKRYVGSVSDGGNNGAADIDQLVWVYLVGNPQYFRYGSTNHSSWISGLTSSSTTVDYHLTSDSEYDRIGKLSKLGLEQDPDSHFTIATGSWHTTATTGFFGAEATRGIKVDGWYKDAAGTALAATPGEVWNTDVNQGRLNQNPGTNHLYARVENRRGNLKITKSVQKYNPAGLEFHYILTGTSETGEAVHEERWTSNLSASFNDILVSPLSGYTLIEDKYRVNGVEYTNVNTQFVIDSAAWSRYGSGYARQVVLNEGDNPLGIINRRKKNTYVVSKIMSTGGDGVPGHTEIGSDALSGAGFTVYTVDAISRAFNMDLTGKSDAQAAALIAQTLKNDDTGDFRRILQAGVLPAQVWSDGYTEHYKEWYGYYPNGININELTTPLPGHPYGATPLVKSYQYKTSEGQNVGPALSISGSGMYFAAEFFTNNAGLAYMPMLPLGDYVLIETTVPYGNLVCDPVVFHITNDHNDGVSIGDGQGTENGLVANGQRVDRKVTAYVRLVKQSSVNSRVVQKDNAKAAKFLIYDDDGRYVKWLSEQSNVNPNNRQAFINNYRANYTYNGKVLVVDTRTGKGTASNPWVYDFFDSANDSWYFQTPMQVPMGTYTVQELHAPEGYVLHGHEQKFRANGTLWEVEDPNQAKWSSFTNKPTANDKGRGETDTSTSAGPVPIPSSSATDRHTIVFDERTARQAENPNEYYIQQTWKDDPAVGKISIYVEGEQLVNVTDGTTVAERVGANFPGYTDLTATIDGTTYDEATYKNKVFNWQSLPVKGAKIEITPVNDITSEDGSGEVLLKAGVPVCPTLITDGNGKAHTNTIETNLGTYKGLPVGQYKVKLTYVDPMYVTDEVSFERTVNINYAGETVPLIFKDEAFKLNRKKIEIAIGKYDASTGKPLDGAVFALVTKSAIKNKDGAVVVPAKTVVALSETVNKGKATFGSEAGLLPLSDYYVVEFTPPKGYTTSNQSWYIGSNTEFYEDPTQEKYIYKNVGYDSDFMFENSPVRTYVRLADYYTDIDLDARTPKTGGTFTIKEGDTVIKSGIQADPNSELLIEGLEIGHTYTITQDTAPSGYVNTPIVDNRRQLPFDQKAFKGTMFDVYRCDLKDLGSNTIEFTVEDTPAVQVINIHNKPIVGKITITKHGRIPDLDATEGTGIPSTLLDMLIERLPEFRNIVNNTNTRNITGKPIQYSNSPLKGTKYQVKPLTDIVYPDGRGIVVLHKDELITYNGEDTFVTKEDGTVTISKADSMVTDVLANVVAEGLLPGRYLVTEIDAPDGYVRREGTGETEKIVEIDAVGTVTAAYTNPDQRMDMELTKTSVAEGEAYTYIGSNGQRTSAVNNAVFALFALHDITNVNGKVLIHRGTQVDQKATNAEGFIQWRTDLPLGDYVAFEIQAPEGYYLNKEVVYYEGEQYKSQESVETVRIPKTLTDDISVVKVFLKDFDNHNELADAVFQVRDAETGNVVIKNMHVNGQETTTVANPDGTNTFVTVQPTNGGHIIYGLDPGHTYLFEEVTPRYEYTYHLFEEDGTPITYDDNGTEKTNIFEYTVPEDKTVDTVELFNKRVVGRILIEKVGEILNGIVGDEFVYDTMALQGATFRLETLDTPIVHPDGQTGTLYEAHSIVVDETAVDENGNLVFDDLYMGTYLVREIKFPDGFVYNLDEDHTLEVGTVVLSDGRENIQVIDQSVVVTNDRQHVRINVEKVDAADQSLHVGGGVYQLYGAEKITAPDGAVLVDVDMPIGEPITLPTEDKPATATEEAQKVGYGTFTSVDESTGKKVYWLDLPLGKYYVREIQAPYGYSLPSVDKRTVYIDVSYDDSDHSREIIATALFKNDCVNVAFDTLDFDDSSLRLEGTKLRITCEEDPDWEPIEVTIGPEGQNPAFCGVFNPGVTYTIEEIGCAEGYSEEIFRKDRSVFTSPYAENADGFPDGERWFKPVVTGAVLSNNQNKATFTVENVGGIQVVTVFNKKVTATITGNKTGEVATGYTMDGDNAVVTYEEKPLEGVTYKLYADEKIYGDKEQTQLLYDVNEFVQEITTDVDGNFKFENLPLGNYYVLETNTLYGMVRSQKKYSADFRSKYEAEFSGDDPVYTSNLVFELEPIVNKRVRIDLGVFDETSIGEPTPGGDPKSELKGKAGIMKYGISYEDLDKTEDSKNREPLDGVEFTVYTAEIIRNVNGDIIFNSGVPVAKATTENGRAVFDVDLPVGHYIIRETGYIPGYAPYGSGEVEFDTDDFLSEDPENKIQVLRYAFDMDNLRSEVRIRLKDVDTKNELADATLLIYEVKEDGTEELVEGLKYNDGLGHVSNLPNTEDEPLVTTLTNDTGMSVYGLTPGKTYKFVEVEPRTYYSNILYDETGKPLGRNGKLNSYIVTLPEDLKVYDIDLYNKCLLGDLTITKKGQIATVHYKAGTGETEIESVDWSKIRVLPGAEYTITAAENIEHPDGQSAPVWTKGTDVVKALTGESTLVTSKNGTCILEGMYFGKYTITEVKAPRGYNADETNNTWDIDLRDDYAQAIQDAKDSGAEDTVNVEVHAKHEVINNRKIVDVGQDPQDNPEIPEPTTPEGDPNGHLKYHTGVYKYGINSKGEKTPVNGAVFRLSAAEDIIGFRDMEETPNASNPETVLIRKGTIIETQVTGDDEWEDDGRAAFRTDLPVGKYKVEEIDAPDGYYSTNAVVYLDTAEWEDDNTTQIIRLQGEIVNPVSEVVITLKDELTGLELEDSTLVIYEKDEEGNLVVAKDPDGNDLIYQTNGEPGEEWAVYGLDPEKDYVLKEVSPHDDYTYILRDEEGTIIGTGDAQNEYPIKINDVVVEEDLSNTPEKTEINLYNRLVTLNLLVSKDGEFLGLDGHEYTEDEITGLLSSVFNYDVKEHEGVEFTVYANDPIYYPDKKHFPEPLLLANEVALQFVRVKNEETGEYGYKAVANTEIDGVAKYLDMYLGSYYIEETKTPVGFTHNWERKYFAVENQGPDVQVVTYTMSDNGGDTTGYHNERQKVHIKITKHDAEDPSITVPGALFVLKIDENVEVSRNGKTKTLLHAGDDIEYVRTGDDGTAEFVSDLPVGYKFHVEEVTPPFGYTSSKDTIEIDTSYDEEGQEVQDYDLHFNNEVTKLLVNVLDLDTKEELGDFVLELTNEDGTPVLDRDGQPVQLVNPTNPDGNVVIKGLEPEKTYKVTIVEPKPKYSDEPVIDNGYTSTYVKDPDVNASDLDLKPSGEHSVTFTIKDEGGIQVASIFVEHVKVGLTIKKRGEVPNFTEHNQELENIEYVMGYLPGAEYEIYAIDDVINPDDGGSVVYKAGDLVKTVTTDETGTINIPDMYIGNYLVREIKAPKGYSRVLQEEYTDQEVRMADEYNSLVDPESGEYPDDFSMEVVFENPRIRVDIGNELPDDIEEVTGQPENPVGDPLHENLGKVGVYKYDYVGDEKVPVPGAQLSLYAREDIKDVYGNTVIHKDTLIARARTRTTGRALFQVDLPVGKYYVKETEAPKGYYLSNAEVDIDTSEWDENDETQVLRFNAEIEEEVVSARVFLKDTNTKNELADAVLVVRDSNDRLVKIWTTENTKGEGVLLERLGLNEEYTITEVIPREGYTYILRDESGEPLNGEVVNQYKFKVKDLLEKGEDGSPVPEEVDITLYNTQVSGILYISKTGEVLSEAEVKKLENGTTTEFTYNQSSLKDVEFTLYAADDIYHPDGIVGFDAKIGKQRPLYTKGEKVNMHVISEVADGVYGVVAVAKTDAKGLAEMDELYMGKFEVRETSVPNGYVKSTEKHYVTFAPYDFETQFVEARIGIIEITNQRQKVSVEITKLDKDTNEPIEGAEFGLYTNADIYNEEGVFLLDKGQLIETAVSDENGIAKFESTLPVKSNPDDDGRGVLYVVKEIKPAEGYLPTDEVVEVDTNVSDGRKVITYKATIYNEQTKVDITKLQHIIEKQNDGNSGVDECKKTLTGVYTLYDNCGNIISSNTQVFNTGSTNTVNSSCNNTCNYAGNTASIGSTCGACGGKCGGNCGNPTCECQSSSGCNGNCCKCDSNKRRDIKTEVLAGATLAVYDEDGVLVDQWVSDDYSHRVKGVKPGKTYTLRELDPATGFSTAKDVRFTVNSVSKDGTYKAQEVEMIDEPIRSIIRVNEVDSKNNTTRLEGVQYHIEDASGNILIIDGVPQKFTSGLDDIEIDKIPVGNYKIVVDYVPDGHIGIDPVDMVIKDTKDPQYFELNLPIIAVEIIAVDKETGDVLTKVKADIMTESGLMVSEDQILTYRKDKMEAGNYIAHVVQGPSGYVPEKQDIKFTVEKVKEVQRFYVPLDHTRIDVLAVDAETYAEIPSGVYVDVYNKNEVPIGTSIPLELLDEYVASGKYTITVVRVPEGYVKPETPTTMYVRQTSELQKYEVPIGIVGASFRPVNANTHRVVRNVKLVLRGTDGTVYARWTSGSKGWMQFRPIKPGNYMFEAETVPKKYEMPEKMPVEIKNIADMQYFEIPLTKKVKSTCKSGGGFGGSGFSGSGGGGAGGSAGSPSKPTLTTTPSKPSATGDNWGFSWVYIIIALEGLLVAGYIWSKKRKKYN